MDVQEVSLAEHERPQLHPTQHEERDDPGRSGDREVPEAIANMAPVHDRQNDREQRARDRSARKHLEKCRELKRNNAPIARPVTAGFQRWRTSASWSRRSSNGGRIATVSIVCAIECAAMYGEKP